MARALKNSGVLARLAEAAGERSELFEVVDGSIIKYVLPKYGENSTYINIAQTEGKVYVNFVVTNTSNVQIINYNVALMDPEHNGFPGKLPEKVDALIRSFKS